MAEGCGLNGLELRSRISRDGVLELSLQAVAVPEPAADEIIVQVEATPVNPSDIGVLLGPAALDAAEFGGTAARPVVRASVPAAALSAIAARLDASLPVGNEGAGTVVRAGADVVGLLGKRVAVFGGAMWAQYRRAKAADCLVLPEGTTPRDGASWYVNPMTALGFVETMRQEGHTALVHTAAASNLGQMLNSICLADGIGLVNIVRSPQQAALLRGQGARHVVDSGAPDFTAALTAALTETGATLGFDAVGGGPLAGQILAAMEAAARQAASGYHHYGSDRHKQVYLYGRLNTGPTIFERAPIGFAWGLGGWLLMPALKKLGAATEARLRGRVTAELKTTFASHYTAEISLAEALRPETMRAYCQRATGEKFLILPQQGVG
ncbi:NADH oxidoreductase [Siccirubricoccus deserti]|uniref:Zinc-binding dehydrogenase n=1 Tax=Siccirubricoccus deserti TaxID=2013562 RepID=A0A9X0R5R8_9PROT|nr:zinc-binding dehydrogenase [Siccirubricoccus deserti]MBC4019068.1 zinc-binding dehydrogenase [Siccirubricoccus deserti]GGC70712.1 NADH oxidoreductase [Siccirubricoccus deserti]